MCKCVCIYIYIWILVLIRVDSISFLCESVKSHTSQGAGGLFNRTKLQMFSGVCRTEVQQNGGDSG